MDELTSLPLPQEQLPEGKHSSPVLILTSIFLILISLSTAGYLYLQNRSLSSQLSAVSSPAPAASPDPTANWQTYTSDKYNFSFRHPSDYQITEPTPGFLVIKNPNDPVPQSGISLETRLSGHYASYPLAQEYLQNSFVNTESTQVDIWEIYQGKVKEGMLTATEFRHAITRYKTGAISAEVIASTEYIKVFDQILSTFKFTNNAQAKSECAGTDNIPCRQGFACKLNVIGDISKGGTCVDEAETNP